MIIFNQIRAPLLAALASLLVGLGGLWFFHPFRFGEEVPFELLSPPRADLEGRVVGVVDGDTLDVSLGGAVERVRLLLVDAPEAIGFRGEPEELSLEAKAFLVRLAQGREVALELDVQSRDRHGRLLAHAYVRTERGFVSLGLELLRRGLAQLMAMRPNLKHLGVFLEAQREAKAEGRGLWRLCSRRTFLSRDLAANSAHLVGRFAGVMLRSFDARRVGERLIVEDGESPLLLKVHLEAFDETSVDLLLREARGNLLVMGKLEADRSGRPAIEVSSPLQLELATSQSAFRKRSTTSSLATATL